MNVPIARIQKSEKLLAIGAHSAVPIDIFLFEVTAVVLRLVVKRGQTISHFMNAKDAKSTRYFINYNNKICRGYNIAIFVLALDTAEQLKTLT